MISAGAVGLSPLALALAQLLHGCDPALIAPVAVESGVSGGPLDV